MTATARQTTGSKQRLALVDGLRGVAASMVVVTHFYERVRDDLSLPGLLAWIFSHGYLGVAVFFVLSGFVITMSAGDRKLSSAFVARFALRRAVRLDPPYWFSIVLSLVLGVVAMVLFGIHRPPPTPQQIAVHLLYLQDLLGYPSISAVYWTLCLEIQFYLFVILLLWLLQAALGVYSVSGLLERSLPRIIFVILVTVSVLELNDVLNLMPHGSFVPYWFCFSLGGACYWVLKGWISSISLAVAALPVLLLGVLFQNDWCLAALGTVAVLYLAGRYDRMSSWMSGRPIQFLGRISYSLYLFHGLVGWSTMSVLLRFAPKPMGFWLALSVGLLGIIGSVTCATVLYWLIEQPSVRLSHRVKLDPARDVWRAAVRESAAV
jgi:peptidoglycan/LPS O-acetylase OafA/YrhL